MLLPLLAQSRIQVVELVAAGETRCVSLGENASEDLARFPLPALAAALLGAQPSARGAEFDVLYGADAQPPGQIVKVRHDLDGRLELRVGAAPVVLQGSPPDPADLQQRYGIGPLLDGDVAWTPPERLALQSALELLAPAELAYLSGLPFQREHGDSNGIEAGFYRVDAKSESRVIVLLDRAFVSDGLSFTGTPERAYPLSTRVILHEIGHALAKLDRERLIVTFQRDSAKYNELVPIYNEYVNALNARYRIVDRIVRNADRRRVRDEIALLEAQQRKLAAIMNDARRRFREIDRQIRRPSAIEQAYGALRGARSGPTVYGRTSVVESFAEAFSLYHLDPDSIARISPEVHAWFESSQHLSAALYPPLEDVPPPAPVGAAPDDAAPDVSAPSPQE